VHGDYFAHNVIFDGDVTRILAVVDWEMATLGDPLADLGWFIALNEQPADPRGNPVPPTFGQEHGFLSSTQLAQRYADRMPEAPIDGIAWYVALAYYKQAVVLEGVHARYLLGMTVGEGFDHWGAYVPNLIDRAAAALAG
jgi:aminoglycoside phosphotransferase (APT) family kinase protein